MNRQLLIVVSVLFLGCSSSRHLEKPPMFTFWKVERDTVWSLRDTVVVSPADSCLMEALLECDSNGRALLSRVLSLQTGRRVTQRVELKENHLRVASHVDADSIPAQMKDRQVTLQQEKVVTVERVVNVVKGYQWFFIYSGILLWVLIVIGLLIRFLRVFILK